MTNILIIFWTCVYCQVYGVEIPFALSVAATESGIPGQEFRVGLLGKSFYGPFNIHRDFKRRWPDIDTLSGNCRRGVAALRGSDKRRVLRRYNSQFNKAYYQAVIKAERRYRRVMRGQR